MIKDKVVIITGASSGIGEATAKLLASKGAKVVLGARRVSGLRREEMALLAGMSVDYYVRLEQGRERSPSAQILDSLGRALPMRSAWCRAGTWPR